MTRPDNTRMKEGVMVEYHFYQNAPVMAGTRTIGDRRRRKVHERLDRIPHEAGARGGGATSSSFALRILQDHVQARGC